MIAETIHSPAIPGAGESVTVTALVLDDAPNPTVTLHYRQDFASTIAYTEAVMLDDGLHGDGDAGDDIYGVSVPGLAEGERLDFTIRADDGASVSAAPPGHDTLAVGGHPSQTYLCKFSDAALYTDFPHYHMITTQRTRDLQNTRNKTEYDATFLQCDGAGECEIFYNVIERYRGQSSLTQNPPSFRIEFPSSHPLPSEMGFDVTRLFLVGQQPARTTLGYEMFSERGDPAPKTQIVRLNTNPLSHINPSGSSGSPPTGDYHQDLVYANVERIDEDFIESQGGDVTPTRLPDRCDGSDTVCGDDDDCPIGESCVPTAGGNVYRGRNTAYLDWRGTNPNSYRVDSNDRNGYQKVTNEEEDDWTDLINLLDALTCSSSDGGGLCTEDTYEGEYESVLDSVADTTQWARWFGLHRLIWNTEGGIYFNSGDDYLLYFRPQPAYDHAVFLPWDLDAYFANQGSGVNETIWSGSWQPAVDTFLKHDAYCGRFVGSMCDALDTFFTQAEMDAALDAIPDEAFDLYSWQAPQGNGPRDRQGMKNWVAGRIAYLESIIVSETTLDGVPGSPYRSPNPAISLSGDLSQCNTHSVLVNGQPADYFDVFDAEWSHEYTLVGGLNTIAVQCFDQDGVEVDRVDGSVYYIPPGGPLRLTMPTRMVKDKTFTLKAEIIDQLGISGVIDWQKWNILGTVSARRVFDQSPVETSITVFETFASGAGGGTPPEDSIRFYNGMGSVSITLDDPESVVGEDIEIVVSVDGRNASGVVSVLDNVPGMFTELSGTLSGDDLTWGPEDGVLHLTADVTVNSGDTLTINPGTLVMVDSGPSGNGTAIIANGTVSAAGTQEDPIFFFPTVGEPAMVLPQTTQNNPPSWRGFYHSNSGLSTYSYVFVTGAGNGAISGHPRPPVFRFQGSHSLLMTDCVAADSPGKILHTSSSGTVTVQRCLFSRCGIGGEFYGSVDVTIEDSWLTRIGRAPESNNVDGDILHLDSSGDQIIRRCILTDSGDEIIDGAANTQIWVEDTIAYDARDKLLSLYGCCGYMDNVLAFGLSGAYDNSGGTVTQSTFALPRNFSSSYPYTIDTSILWPGSASTCASGSSIDYTIIGSPGHLGCGTGNLSRRTRCSRTRVRMTTICSPPRRR